MKKKDYTMPIVVVVGLFVLTMMLVVAVTPEPAPGTIKIMRKPASASALPYDGRMHMEVIDQTAADKVAILSLALKENGYSVIRKEEKGKPGKIIGVSPMLAPGLYSNRWVTLIESVAPGEMLFAVLYKDNGDGVFSVPNDAPVKGDEKTMMGGTGIAKFMVI